MKPSELKKLALHLRAALDLIEAELQPIDVSPEIQAEVDRKLAERICLAWDHLIPENDRIVRGQCETDYVTTRAKIRSGKVSEAELIREGKLTAEVKKGGRKSAQEIAAEQLAKELKVAELADRYNNRKKPKDKDK